MKRFVFSLMIAVLLAAGALAQSAQETFAKRTTLAVRYVENKKTTVNVNGTSLAPRVLGKADVEYKKNEARIRIKLSNWRRTRDAAQIKLLSSIKDVKP